MKICMKLCFVRKQSLAYLNQGLGHKHALRALAVSDTSCEIQQVSLKHAAHASILVHFQTDFFQLAQQIFLCEAAHPARVYARAEIIDDVPKIMVFWAQLIQHDASLHYILNQF